MRKVIREHSLLADRLVLPAPLTVPISKSSLSIKSGALVFFCVTSNKVVVIVVELSYIALRTASRWL
jgi:hypothetical protein